MPEGGLIATPDSMTDAEAATLPCAAVTAWHALVRLGNLQAGQTVLVLGTGGVSLFALQIAKLKGATVIATSSSDEKLAKAKEMGADHTINYRTTPDWHKEVLRLTEKRGVDHVVEVGGGGTINKSISSTCFNGQVHLIGVPASSPDADSAPDLMPVLMKSLPVGGVLVGSREMFAEMISAFADAGVTPVVDKIFPFAQATEAHAVYGSGEPFREGSAGPGVTRAG